MPARRLPFSLLVVLLVVSTSVAHASTIHKRPTKAQRVSYYVPVKSGPALHAAGSQSFGGSPFAGSFGLPSSPDNWRGGTGNWSNSADWTAGLPGTSNDVLINTGNDTVTLDTNSSINSLTLGGSSGNSSLTGDGNGHTVTIAGALTVNQSGSLTLYGDTVTAGVSSQNYGSIDLENSARLQVTGDLNNAGSVCVACNAQILTESGGTVLIAGSVNNTGGFSLGGIWGSESGGTVAVSGNLVNSGGINIQNNSSFQVQGNANNSGVITSQICDGGFYCGGYNSFSVAGNLINTGTISVDGGFGVSGNVTNSGQISTPYTVYSALDSISIGSLTNTATGSLVLASESGQGSLGSLNNNGYVEVDNSNTLRIDGNAINTGQIVTSVDTDYNSTFVIIGGKLTNAVGGTFTLGYWQDIADIGYVSNAGTMSLIGTLNVTGGSHAVTNALPGFLNTGTVTILNTLNSTLSYVQTSGQTTVDGTLHIGGHGIINLAGGSLYGSTADGFGIIEGNITSNASINIGDAPMTVGALNFMGNYTQGANGSLTFDIAGNASGQYDQLNVSGHAQLNGLMTVDLLNGYIPQLGNTFEVMTYGSESGTFSMVVGLPINNQEHFVLEYNSTNLTLDVQSGQISGPTIKGGNGTYFVSEPFISTAGEGSSSSTLAQNNSPGAATPEPASIVLFASGLAGIAGVLRRKRKG